MKILALNTANKQSDIALISKGSLFKTKMSTMAKHSESALVGINNILTSANAAVENLDAMAVVVGPGSFTGIRIGISLALGFKTAYENIKLIEITAFQLLARQFLNENENVQTNFTCVFNALSGKFFLQEFDKHGNFVSSPKMVEGLQFLQQSLVTVGLKEENLSFLTHHLEIKPETLAQIAAEKYERGEFSPNLSPLYLRKSQAEDMLEKKENKN